MRYNGIRFHPLPVRVWHWTNAFIVFVLIVTGVELRFTDVKVFSNYSFVVALHKYAGYLLALSFFFWIAAYQIVGGLARNYILSVRDVRSIPAQVAYYIFGYFRGDPDPFRRSREVKFNVLQKMAYSFIMFIAMPLIIVTGILFGNIMVFYGAIAFFGGIRIIDAAHVTVGYIFVIYLIVHLYMATLGRRVTSRTKAMITGYEEE